MIFCQRCGAELPPGSLKYLVTIHVTADFDGVLPAEGDREDLEAFMHQLDAEDPVSLENDVYQSQGYLLCPACKRTVLADPLGLARDGEDVGEGGRVH
ncbi:MAG: hypothetical protein HZB55_23795 [Deltaproteobacteria bacterium]|nr:hypothetical protein [Deltaproteobacteria bacterium]